MKKQFYYSVHANKDQVQEQEIDPELYELLSHLQVSKTNRLLDCMTKSFMSLEGNRTRLFYGFKYNDYTNLSKLEAGRRVYVHGMKGVHDLKRATSYFNFYVSEDSSLAGSGFFNYVFGTEYPTEYELRTKGPEEIKQILNASAESPEGQQNTVSIKNKDRMLVCRIAERLWTAQLKDSTCRLIILLPSEEIYDESVDLLKQLYLLLPQKLRLNMGFAVDCSLSDMKKLTEECDLPIHIFTMRAADREELEAHSVDLKLKYPVVFFDTTNLNSEPYDEERLSLLVKLSRKLSSSSDAKMTYIEKKVLKEGNRMVSFKNLEEIFDMVKKDDFFWWDRKDLEKPEEVMEAYRDQKELMDDEELKKEALYSFYVKMLPWKEYAFSLNEIVRNHEYPRRDEILNFFGNELCYGKILDASAKIQQEIQKEANEHEMNALGMQKQTYDRKIASIQEEHAASLLVQQKKLGDVKAQNAELQEQYKRTVAEHQQTVSEIKEKHVQEIQIERNKAEEDILRVKEEARSQNRLFQEQNSKLQAEKIEIQQENVRLQEEFTRLQEDNTSLSRRMNNLLRDGVDFEVERLNEEVQAKESEIEDFKRKTRIVQNRLEIAKRCMIVAFVAAGLFLVGTVVFGIFTFKNSSSAKAFEKQVQEEQTKVTDLQQRVDELTAQAETVEELQKQLEEKDAELEKLKSTPTPEASSDDTSTSADEGNEDGSDMEGETSNIENENNNSAESDKSESSESTVTPQTKDTNDGE